MQNGGNRCYKVTECSVFLRVHATVIPPIEITTSWPFHWHAAGENNWPLLNFLLLYWIAGIGIVFHCIKYSLIYSYIQSLNPILKILKIKYLQIRHKACLSPFLKTNWPPRHNLFHENPVTPRPPWKLATPEISHEIEGAVQIPHP